MSSSLRGGLTEVGETEGAYVVGDPVGDKVGVFVSWDACMRVKKREEHVR